VNIFNINEMMYKEFKNKINLSNIKKELTENFDKDFYFKFFETVVCNFSDYYKKEFTEKFFESVFNGSKNYGNNLEWIMELFKKYDLINLSNKEKLLMIVLNQNSNLFNLYDDFMIIKKEFTEIDNFKDRIFLITNNREVIDYVLNSIENLHDFKILNTEINKVKIAKNYIGIKGRIYDLDESKVEGLKEREKVLKILLEKKEIKDNINKDNIKNEIVIEKSYYKKRI